MHRFAIARPIVAIACVLGFTGNAMAQKSSDMCTAPQMKTEKWKSRSENGGMILLVPPGFGASGIGGGIEESGAHYYSNGEHRLIVVGFGPGLQSLMHYDNVSEKGECETTISGRRVSIIIYNYVIEDANYSASGNAGGHFAAVARYYPNGSQREVYVALISNSASDLKYFKPLFFAVSFDGQAAATTASAATAPAAASTATTASSGATVSNASDMHPIGGAVAATPVSTQSCAIAEQPAGSPAVTTVIDSAVVATQLVGKPEIPNGYELMTVQYGATGAFSAVKAGPTNFDDATQRELATAIGPNIRTHDAAAPATLLLRVDASMRGLHYTALPAGSCVQ